MLDKTKIDLSKPAFGSGAQTLKDVEETETKDTSVEDTKQDIKVEPAKEEEADTSVEENKVSYSRFKTIHQRALDAEREAERWRTKAEEIEQSRTSRRDTEESNTDMPVSWVKLYGDSEASQEAWKIQQQRETEIERRAYEAGQRGAQELKQIENARVNENLSMIDENFEDLSALVGRNLTEKEQSSVLDIVDNYTPKDDEGNYLGAIMTFDKAWEIYELKQNTGKTVQRKSRDAVASLSGTNTQGDTNVEAEKDKNFNPLDWKAWKKRIGS